VPHISPFLADVGFSITQLQSLGYHHRYSRPTTLCLYRSRFQLPITNYPITSAAADLPTSGSVSCTECYNVKWRASQLDVQ